MIFEGTVRDNITMGRADATDEEIASAISDVELEEFVLSKEEGLDYLLVGLGQNVSGGQKQRINMARTVIREAPIYIFDDSFSALDYLTERKIQQKLFSRLRGRTKILVTQRVSTALAADRIYVMDRGRISAVGTHNELLHSSDIYREICISQLGNRVLGGDILEV
jgi:ATP-binding cassette subfamily B protein